jgi:hypothetical protein
MASSSLGRLTLDLIAKTGGFESGMDRAARHSQRRTREMQRQWDTVRGVILKVGAALGVAFSVRQFQQIISRNAQLIDSLAKTSAAMGIPIERLQTLEVAAKQAGTSGEKLAAGLDRMQRSLGDAARSGTGANKAINALGLDIDNLLRLRPDQQFELISKALMGVENETVRASLANEIFGRNWRELSNLMKDVANDGLTTLQRELEQLGFILTSEGAARVEQMNNSLDTLSRFSQGVGQQMTVALAPAIRAVALQLTDAAKESGGFGNEFQGAADKIVQGVAWIQDGIAGIKVTFQLVGRTIAVVALTIELQMAKLADSIFNGPINAINTLISLLNRIPGLEVGSVGPINQQAAANVALLRRAIAEGQRDIQDLALSATFPGAGLIERYEQAKKEAEIAGREAAERFAKGLNSGLNDDLDGAGGAAAAVRKVVDEIDRELERLIAAGQRVYEQTRTPAEQLAIRIGELNGLLDAGAISWDTYARAIFQAQEAFDATREKVKALSDESEKTNTQMSEFAVQAARNIQSAFADFLFDPFNSSLRDMARNFALTLNRMVSELLAQQLLLSFFNLPIFGGGGLGTTLFGGARAEGGPVSPGKAYLVGERGPELFVPNTAGNVQANGDGGGVRIINVIDPNLVGDYMTGSGGDRVVLNVLERNRNAIKQLVLG